MKQQQHLGKIAGVITLCLVLSLTACFNIKNDVKTVDEDDVGQKPNIIIFYVDDLGYGDLGCYGAKGVETPNVDKLAAAGIRYTDAHASAATCTPSRYSLLTGEYAFRNNAAVLPGDAPLIIDTAKVTLPSLLKSGGYRTAVVGKWHLGLGNGDVDWNRPITPGPLDIGFDYSFLLPSTGDRVPSVYLENRNVVGLKASDAPIEVSYGEKVGDLPTGTERPELLRQAADPQHSGTIINGISRIGYMNGGESAWWTDEDFPDVFTTKAIDFIEASQKAPFFLFFSFHDIHVPRLPNERFIGASNMGARGDAIAQMDWMTGQIMNALEKMELLENTLVIFTSDNGPVLNDGYEDGAVEKLGQHRPAGIFRGGKYSTYEAGTRVPTIAYWKGTIQAGTSDALWSQVDLMTSLGKITKIPIPANASDDGADISKALLSAGQHGRKLMVEEAYTLSLRSQDWKYIAPIEASKPLPKWISDKGIESGHSYEPQLYHLDKDPKEQKNLAAEFPEKVDQMQKSLDSIKAL